MHFVRCTLYFIDAVPTLLARISRLNNERLSFASRFIIEKPLSAIHVSLKTRQTRLGRFIVSLCFEIASPITSSDCEYQTSDFKLSWCTDGISNCVTFDALCNKLDGAPRSQERLGISRGRKVSCLISDLFLSSCCLYSLSVDLSAGKKCTIENFTLRRW